MSKTVVIGVGSSFGMDRIGLAVVETLRQSPQLESLHFKTLDRPGLTLLDEMQGYDEVVLIDALYGSRTGKIHELLLDDLLDQTGMYSSHEMDVAGALNMGKVLDLLPATLHIWAIEMPLGATVEEPLVHELAGQLTQRLQAFGVSA